jgi:hypothetical protein
MTQKHRRKLINFIFEVLNKGITKRCRLSLLTNSALVRRLDKSKCGGREGVAGSQPMSTAVHIT